MERTRTPDVVTGSTLVLHHYELGCRSQLSYDPQVIGWGSETGVWIPQSGPEGGALPAHLQCAELCAELSAEVPPE